MMVQKRVERGQWVGQTKSLYCPFLTPLISWHLGRRKKRRVKEDEEGEVQGVERKWKLEQEEEDNRRNGRTEDTHPVRSQATDGEQLVREPIREQWEGLRPATVTAHLTQTHTAWWKLTHHRTHFNITKQMLSQAVINALRCSIRLHQCPAV